MILSINNLSHSKGAKRLFHHLSFQLAPGERVLVQGANGAGKSTLLKIVAGLLTPDKGSITYQGYALHNETANYFNEMSYLGHQNGLKKALTPFENVQAQLALANVSVTRTQIETLFEDLALTAHSHQLCETLSAGECRKVALACTLLKNKKLWILDEPFTSLDKASDLKLQGYCEQHLAKGGMIVFSCHQGAHRYADAQIIPLSS